MKHRIPVLLAAGLMSLACGSVYSQSAGWLSRGQGAGGGVCSQFPALSATVTAAAGLTNGIIGVPGAGEVYTISVAGPGTGTFRIVGDPAGAVTYAGPANVPATLSYAVPSSTPPAGAVGVGYFFTAGAGTVTITASCTPGAIPSMGAWGRNLLGVLVLLGGLAGVAFMRRRPHAAR